MVGIVAAVDATMRSEMKCILTMNKIRSSPLSCALAPGRCPQVVESAMVDNPVSSQVSMVKHGVSIIESSGSGILENTKPCGASFDGRLTIPTKTEENSKRKGAPAGTKCR